MSTDCKAEEESKCESNERPWTSPLPSVGSPLGGVQVAKTYLVEFLVNPLNCQSGAAGLMADKEL